MRKRLNLQCWQCNQAFELTLNIVGQPLFSKECPYCHAQCIIDLDPYRQSTTEILRGAEIDPEKEELILPTQIPTTKPDKDDGT